MVLQYSPVELKSMVRLGLIPLLFHFGGNNVLCLSYVVWPERGQHPCTTTLGVPVYANGAELAAEKVGNLPPR